MDRADAVVRPFPERSHPGEAGCDQAPAARDALDYFLKEMPRSLRRDGEAGAEAGNFVCDHILAQLRDQRQIDRPQNLSHGRSRAHLVFRARSAQRHIDGMERGDFQSAEEGLKAPIPRSAPSLGSLTASRSRKPRSQPVTRREACLSGSWRETVVEVQAG